MLKRVADWLEKFSAGSMLIGWYQDNIQAITIGMVVFGVMLFIQHLIRRAK